jgi:tetratricopeptide (TPR) repeat protein
MENTINCAQQVSTDNLIQEADLHFQNKSFPKAEQLYRTILLNNPRNHKASLGVALAVLQQNKVEEAIQFMQQATEIAPEIALYRRNLGELLRRVGQLKKAIASHQIAISIEPHFAENHFLLGLAYNDNHQYELAIRHYHIALSYNPRYGLGWNNLGASLESMGDKQTAKIAYTTAIALNSNHAEAQNNLGAIYSEEGRLSKARTHFEAAITANPDFVDAHYNLSLIKTYTPDDPHLIFLKSTMKKINYYPISTRIRYYFALGKAFDDTSEYSEAFKMYTEGNRLHYLRHPWDKKKLQEIVNELPNIFTQSFLKQSKIPKDKRCPIFIVGMPRAGSTLIEQILSSHESIFGAGELSILDEIIHETYSLTNMPFNIWMKQLSDQDFKVLREKYLDRTWKLAPNKMFIIDKMPSNSFYIGMIYRMLPTAKIIHTIRDPMDSCFSCFTHLFKDNMSFTYDLTSLGNYYILYAKAMQHWHTFLPKNSIFDLSYEQLVENVEVLSKKLLDYIGLPWDPNCLNFYKNNRIVKTASLTQVRKPIYKTSVQRWRHFESELEPLLQIVSSYRNREGISS